MADKRPGGGEGRPGGGNQPAFLEVETDKATMEYESIQEGTLLKVVLPEGSAAVVGQTIAIIGSDGDDITSLVQEAESEAACHRGFCSGPSSQLAHNEKPAQPKGFTFSRTPPNLRHFPVIR